ncbi:MAG: NAD-dependent deacylase [Anaerolineae bacterium]|nr:NAD-dependent deacylase [Anaerolineae bacterium]MDW8069280.1 NAD-dependent deacylase [Anaerolineae bacterium]
MEDWEIQLARAADLLKNARHAVALTGAGISTPSGIPDFRSPGSGLWEKEDPMEVASIYVLRREPQRFYQWVRPLVALMRQARPNPAHVALAQLEAAGRLQAVITQNIDGLHQRAGSRVVLELHGHLRTATCLNCFRQVPTEGLEEIVEQGKVPHCSACGGVLKPDAVLFGEQLPTEVFTAAMEHARQADLMLVVGSSLMVMPAARLPAITYASGGALLIFNQQSTYADTFAAAVFRADVVETLPRLVRLCLEGD